MNAFNTSNATTAIDRKANIFIARLCKAIETENKGSEEFNTSRLVKFAKANWEILDLDSRKAIAYMVPSVLPKKKHPFCERTHALETAILVRQENNEACYV